MATKVRDEKLAEGRGEELGELVGAVRTLQDELLESGREGTEVGESGLR